MDPSTVLEWNAERYSTLTNAANSLISSIENLSKSQPAPNQYLTHQLPNQQVVKIIINEKLFFVYALFSLIQ